ncbi:MAG: HAD-IIIA family hydrolase [Candidatus Omnitrophota bacterium]
MEAIKLFLSIASITVIGFSVLRIIIRKDIELYSPLEKAALSYGLGLGCVAFELLTFAVAGLSFDIPLLILPWIPVFLFALFMTERQGLGRFPGMSLEFFTGKRVFPALLLSIMIIQGTSVFIRALSKPLESYDGIINFGIKSKIFLMNNGIPMTTSGFEGIGKGHMDYPLLIPLAETWVYKFLGYHNDLLVKVLFPLVFVSFLIAFYFSLKRLFNARFAILFTFLACTVPQIANFATVGYADLTFTFMVTMAFIFLFQYFKERKGSFLMLSSVFSGIGMLTKNEGISFVLASLAVIMLFILNEKDKMYQARRFLLFYVFPLAVVIFPWVYFRGVLGLQNTDINFSEMTFSRFLENASYIPFILNKFQQEVFGPKKWNILWIMVIGFTILRFSRLKEFRIRQIGIFLLLNMAIYFASFMVLTGKDLFFHINTILSRLMMHFSGISLLFLASLVWEDVNKYVFIDRDGVINKDPGGWTEYSYVTRWEDFHFLPGALESLKKLADSGYKSVIISNQQGVGKGYFTKDALEDVTARMLQEIKKSGGSVAGVYYCTHTKEEDCSCRKPKTGLFTKAGKELGIQDFEGKYYIGDTERDIESGKKVGLKTILVISGKSSREDAEKWDHKPDHICSDLMEAVDIILGEK